MNTRTLTDQAVVVLKMNDLGGKTRPTAKLYPHQWLWDSAFIAIGLRHLDVVRAQEEIRTLLQGQWKNGMVPYIIFGEAKEYHAGPTFWRSEVSPNCPEGVKSTGGTQPPMIAEAVVRIGQSLKKAERLAWYKEVYPSLAAYHEWLYRDRDPERSGLVTLYHSWESGLDNNPPWMEMVHKYAMTAKLRLIHKNPAIAKFLERFRKDTSVVPASERMSTLELMAFYDLVKRMRAMKYDDAMLYRKHKLAIQDIGMNSILVRATQHLGAIAQEIGKKLPKHTQKAYERGVGVLDTLWDEETGYYYSKDLRSGQLIKLPNISSFTPLYAGKLPKARVERLLAHLSNPQEFGTKHPIPTTPVNSPYFKQHCYWQGPSWINTNWLILTGLRMNGQTARADKLKRTTLDMISKGGMYEYFSPLDGKPAGAPNFSWTAALTIELLNEK